MLTPGEGGLVELVNLTQTVYVLPNTSLYDCVSGLSGIVDHPIMGYCLHLDTAKSDMFPICQVSY